MGMLRTGTAAVILLAAVNAAAAQDALKVAVGQRGGWEQCVSELGQNAGFFKTQNLTLDILYTQGSAETLQSVISGSVDIGIGLGTHALLGAYAKGAPIRAIGASFTSADDQFYTCRRTPPFARCRTQPGAPSRRRPPARRRS